MIRDTSSQDVVMTSSKRSPKKLIIATTLLILGAVSANAFMNNTDVSHSIDRTSVQIATVERGELLRDISATGRIVAANAPQLYSPEQGYVNLKVNAGDEVVTGQLLAQVDSPSLANQLQQQQAELARQQDELARQELDTRRQTLNLTKQADLALLDLTAAQRENRRATISIKDHLISQIDLEKSEDELARAKVTHQHAIQEVDLAKDTLAFELASARNTFARQQLVVTELQRKIETLSVRATVDGMVGNLFIQDRALVSANEVLMTLVDLSAYEAEINIPESYANQLRQGMNVELKMGSQTVTGQLSGISPEVSNREVTARVKFAHDASQSIRQNQQLSARVLLEQKPNVVKVRRGSFTQAGGAVAYKVQGDIAQRIAIQLGATSMREVEVLSGVQPGDQIIISNYDEFAQSNAVRLR